MKTTTRLICLVAISIFFAAAAPLDDDGRIVNGVQMPVSMAPYIVQLIHNSGKFCGGTMIAPNYVLTAAHCVYGASPESMTIHANVSKIHEKGVERSVSGYEIHPDYDPKTMHSDVAVVELTQPIEGMTYLPLCDQPLNEGRVVQISGWGQPGINQTLNTHLHTIFVPVRSQMRCSMEHGAFVSQNMICVSGQDKRTTCRGDSGGPAVSRKQVCGVVAFGTCGARGISSALTHVYDVRDFINRAMGKSSEEDDYEDYDYN